LEKIKLEICSGTSCHLMGAFDLHQAIEALESKYKQYLEINPITCLGKCGQGPNVRFNGEIYTHVTPDQLKNLIEKKLKKRGEADGSE